VSPSASSVPPPSQEISETTTKLSEEETAGNKSKEPPAIQSILVLCVYSKISDSVRYVALEPSPFPIKEPVASSSSVTENNSNETIEKTANSISSLSLSSEKNVENTSVDKVENTEPVIAESTPADPSVTTEPSSSNSTSNSTSTTASTNTSAVTTISTSSGGFFSGIANRWSRSGSVTSKQGTSDTPTDTETATSTETKPVTPAVSGSRLSGFLSGVASGASTLGKSVVAAAGATKAAAASAGSAIKTAATSVASVAKANMTTPAAPAGLWCEWAGVRVLATVNDFPNPGSRGRRFQTGDMDAAATARMVALGVGDIFMRFTGISAADATADAALAAAAETKKLREASTAIAAAAIGKPPLPSSGKSASSTPTASTVIPTGAKISPVPKATVNLDAYVSRAGVTASPGRFAKTSKAKDESDDHDSDDEDDDGNGKGKNAPKVIRKTRGEIKREAEKRDRQKMKALGMYTLGRADDEDDKDSIDRSDSRKVCNFLHYMDLFYVMKSFTFNIFFFVGKEKI
jgi:hypothetical protein